MNAGRSVARRAGVVACAMALAACTNMSGLSGSSSYACKAPEGVICDSVSGTYANAVQNNLPSQKTRAVAPPTKEGTATATPAGTGAAPALPSRPATVTAAAATPMMPARSSCRVLRLWFKPWEDADRDLYDQGFVYVQIDSGGWLIDHVQRQIREGHTPLRPPPRGAPSGDGKESPAPPPSKSLSRPAAADTPLHGWSPPAARPDSTD